MPFSIFFVMLNSVSSFPFSGCCRSLWLLCAFLGASPLPAVLTPFGLATGHSLCDLSFPRAVLTNLVAASHLWLFKVILMEQHYNLSDYTASEGI